MIKSPFTKTGKVRYYELFKISFLLSFIYVIISRFLNLTSTFNEATIPMIIAFFALLVIESYIIIRSVFIELIELIKSYIIKDISINDYEHFYSFNNNYLISYIQIKQDFHRFIKLRVIRC